MLKDWTVVVTTAPRQECTLIETLESLEDCGWIPTIFAEPQSSLSGIRARFDNETRLGVWHNWLKAVRWAIEQSNEYILTVQDDIDFHPESKLLLDELDWPEDAGYISLYTPSHYQNDDRLGFYPVPTKCMWGACALVFKKQILIDFLKDPRVQSWRGISPKTKSIAAEVMALREKEPWRVQNSDYIIGKIVRTLNKQLYYFNPSLCSHIARYSSIGHGGNSGKRNARLIADHSKSLKEQIYVSSNIDRI
jgi:hypothetical protein